MSAAGDPVFVSSDSERVRGAVETASRHAVKAANRFLAKEVDADVCDELTAGRGDHLELWSSLPDTSTGEAHVDRECDAGEELRYCIECTPIDNTCDYSVCCIEPE